MPRAVFQLPMPRKLIHYFCVVLLLVAQQGALVHAAWHAGGGTAHVHDAHDHVGDAHDQQNTRDYLGDPPDSQANLCALDLAFGEMLGGAHGASGLPIMAWLPAEVATTVFNPRLGTEAVPAHSRGPPIFL